MSFGTCTAIVGSQTLAIKAQKTLAQAAIHAEVVKADSSRSGHGCAYGVEVSCAQINNVRTILTGARIPVKFTSDGGGSP